MSKSRVVSVIALLFLLARFFPDNALARNLKCPNSVTDSIKLLQNADRMESKYISEGANKSKIFCSYAKLVTSPNPETSFNKVFNGAKTEVGKMYCLFWYFTKQRKSYELKKDTINQNAKITLVHACIVSTYSAKELISKIENGEMSHLLMVDYGEPIGGADIKASPKNAKGKK